MKCNYFFLSFFNFAYVTKYGSEKIFSHISCLAIPSFNEPFNPFHGHLDMNTLFKCHRKSNHCLKCC